MERATAVKQLSKLLGRRFAYEYRPEALPKEEREQAGKEKKAVDIAKSGVSQQMEARRKLLMNADVEYQALLDQYKKLNKESQSLGAKEHICRVTVGHTGNLGSFSVFHVEASGDSWEEVIAKIKAEKAVRAEKERRA